MHAQHTQCGATPNISVHGHAGEVRGGALCANGAVSARLPRMVAASSGCSAATRDRLASHSRLCKPRSYTDGDARTGTTHP